MPCNPKENMLVPIKDFAAFTGIKQSALRYYDDLGLFKPIARGENNYRYYSLTQIQTIKLIEMLRTLDIPLKKVEKLMVKRDPESMLDILVQHELQLTNELRQLQESFSLIHTIRTLIQGSLSRDENEISIKFENERVISVGPVNDFKNDKSYHRAYSEYYRYARGQRINLGYPIGGYFEDFASFIDTPERPTHFFSLDPKGFDIAPAGHYVTGYTRGDYGVLNDLPQRLQEFIKANKLTTIGPIMHVYPLNELSIRDPNQYLSRVSVRIS